MAAQDGPAPAAPDGAPRTTADEPAPSTPAPDRPASATILDAIQDLDGKDDLTLWAEAARSLSDVKEVIIDNGSSVRIALANPLPAAKVSAALAFARPYGVSWDVHQREWHLVLWQADVPDSYRTRIHTEPPRFGQWKIDFRLSSRPSGDLPGVASGASPAYDLTQASATVHWIMVDRDTDA